MNTKRALFIDSVYEGGRNFVGGISVAFMLSRGISPADVAALKMIQAAVVFVGEIPTGIFADRYGRRASLILAAILSASGLSLLTIGSSFLTFAAGEFLLALSLCCWSGAFEAWAIDAAKLENKQTLINRFFHHNTAWNQSAVVISGAIGGYLAGTHWNYLATYIAGIASMVILVGLLIASPRDHTTHPASRLSVNSIGQQLRTMLQTLLSNAEIRRSVKLMILLQFLVQPLLHYWQPLSQGAYGFSVAQLGYVFSGFCLGSAVLGFAAAKWGKTATGPVKSKTGLNIPGLLVVWSGSLLGVGCLNPVWMSLTALVLAQVTYFHIRAKVVSTVAFHCPKDERASIMSGASFVSRIGMMMSLGLISLLFSQDLIPNSVAGYQTVYAIWGSIGACLILRMLFSRQTNWRKSNVSLPTA